MSAVQRILVRGPNWAGDLVMATPGFRSLRAGFPGAHITLQLRPGLEPLIAGAPWFDALQPLRSYHRGWSALLRESLELRRQPRFDLGLCVPDSFSSLLHMRVAGVRRVVGYRRSGRGLLLQQPVTPPPEWGRRRMVARERFVLGLTAALGCEERGTRLELFTTAEEEARADALLGPASTSPPMRVALAPGASYGSAKLWPGESFAQVGDALAADGAEVLLVGAPSEAALARRVEERMHAAVRNLVTSLDLGALKAVLRRCALLVCNDAGARHVAVAFGVPCVVLFGPTSLEKTNLNLEAVTPLHTEVECRPCYRRECPIDHRCMTRLEPRRVIEAARAALRAS